MSLPRRHESWYEGSLSRWTDHFAVYVAEIPRHRSRLTLSLLNPTHSWYTAGVFGGIAGGQIVAARQVVVGEGIEVESVVGFVRFADRLWSFA
ncbi:hypothetical protein D9M69_683980 [compost metagenome]